LPSNNAITAGALLALTAAYAIEQNPMYRNIVEGFSVSRLIDGARAPRQKAAIMGEVAPVLPTNNAAEVDARIIQGFMELEAERVAEERALAASPSHPMSAEYVHVPGWAGRAVTARNVQETYVDGDGVTRTRTRVTGNIVLPRRITRAQ
jgi:hypothetical protein